MKDYDEIHLWDFPARTIYIRLKDKFRHSFFKKAISMAGSQDKLVRFLNLKSKGYGITSRFSRLNLYSWIKGRKNNGHYIRRVNVPLWVVIEISKLCANTGCKSNHVMLEVENNTYSYSVWGNSNPVIPKLPILVTPELVSIIFHFMGDGHIGGHRDSSSYRQMNRLGLDNFLYKVRNVFGKFNYSIPEYRDGKLYVPKAITDIAKYYFKLPSTNTFEAYVPRSIKYLPRDFLLAGLLAFIVDEGHVDEVITIYSKNLTLISDIKELAINCGFLCNQIREKYACGKFDVYRFSISSKSYNDLYQDIARLSKEFPTCTLAHKQNKLLKKI